MTRYCLSLALPTLFFPKKSRLFADRTTVSAKTFKQSRLFTFSFKLPTQWTNKFFALFLRKWREKNQFKKILRPVFLFIYLMHINLCLPKLVEDAEQPVILTLSLTCHSFRQLQIYISLILFFNIWWLMPLFFIFILVSYCTFVNIKHTLCLLGVCFVDES